MPGSRFLRGGGMSRGWVCPEGGYVQEGMHTHIPGHGTWKVPSPVLTSSGGH